MLNLARFTSQRDRVSFSRMPTSVSFPKIRRKRSKLHGFGVFADQTINKNKRIIDYAGELISNKQSESREDRYLKKGCIWVFRVNRNWSRDAAVGGNVARFINHSCTPNCWIEVADKTIWVRASRTIRKGEELTYDYNTEGDKVIPCRCRPGCKTKL
jgi:SET domain-containing protein